MRGILDPRWRERTSTSCARPSTRGIAATATPGSTRSTRRRSSIRCGRSSKAAPTTGARVRAASSPSSTRIGRRSGSRSTRSAIWENGWWDPAASRRAAARVGSSSTSGWAGSWSCATGSSYTGASSRTPPKRSRPRAPTDRARRSRTSGELVELRPSHRERGRHLFPGHASHDSKRVHDQIRPGHEAGELLAPADLVELLAVALKQREPVEVTAMGVEEHDLQPLDLTVALQLPPVLDALLEDVLRVALAAPHRRSPTDEQDRIGHLKPPFAAARRVRPG